MAAPVTPNPVPQDVPKTHGSTVSAGSWHKLSTKARTMAQITALFGFLLAAGAAVGYIYSETRPQALPKAPTITNLSQDELNKLGQISGSLGTSGQVLNIASDALFRSKVDISGDLSVGGHLNANGPVTLSALNIAGASGSTGLNVGTNLVVGGTATFQKSLTVADLASIGNLNVSGSASVNSLNATSIAVRNLAISGPVTIGHLVTQGPTPTLVVASIGAGGTASISGNDTAGTINLNTGTSPGTTLATITFRATYGTTPHIVLTPLNDASAAAGAYVTRTTGGFQIHVHSAPASATLAYDFIIVQ